MVSIKILKSINNYIIKKNVSSGFEDTLSPLLNKFFTKPFNNKNIIAKKLTKRAEKQPFIPSAIFNYTGRKITPGFQPFKGDSSKLSYMPDFELGEKINSGIQATVYNVKGYDSLVARVERKAKFNPYNLSRTNGFNLFAKSSDGKVTIMKKLEGEPLYGKGWNIHHRPNEKEFNETLDTLMSLPDSTYSQLIDDIREIRKSGLDIDVINPNNFLLDMKNKRINIVDLHENTLGNTGVRLRDIVEPLLDDRRVMSLTTLSETTRLKIKSFIDRIISIGQSKNLYFAMEPLNHNKLQTNLVYLYHNDKLMINSIRK